MALTVKNLPVMQETQVQTLDREDPLRRLRLPLQYSCLENSMDRGAWWATVMGLRRVRHSTKVTTYKSSDSEFKKN